MVAFFGVAVYRFSFSQSPTGKIKRNEITGTGRPFNVAAADRDLPASEHNFK